MIDNFELIKPFFYFNEANDMFLHCQVIRRGKDHPDLPAANRTIMQYFVTSREHLEKLRPEIIHLCEYFGARAYINLAPRDNNAVTKLAHFKMAERIYNGDFKKPWKIFSSAVGECKSRAPRWIVDIDEDMFSNKEQIKDWIYQIGLDFGKHKVDIQTIILAEIPTKSGVHLITIPFNLQKFKEKYSNIDVHKNNPTILYIPRVLDN